METLELEQAIYAALLERSENKADKQWAETLAKNTAHALSIGRNLDHLLPEDVKTAILSIPEHPDFVKLANAIRYHAGMTYRKQEKERESRISELRAKDSDIVGWGYLLRCWDAYTKTGDLSAIRILNVTFLSDWLQKRQDLLLEDEKAWALRQAERDAASVPEERKKTVRDSSYAEACAMVVMTKFHKSMNTSPEKTRAYLAQKRQEYTNYYKKYYNMDPDWSLPGITRELSCSVFKKTQ